MRHVQRGVSMTFLVVAILVVAIASAYGYFAFSQDLKKKVTSINSFEECAKHYPIMESYPEQCKTPDGKHFTRQLSEEEKQRIVSPFAPSPSVKSTSWKIYRSSKNGYELQYPSEWFAKEQNGYIVFYPLRISKEALDRIKRETILIEPEIRVEVISNSFSPPDSKNSLYLIKPASIEIGGKQGVYYQEVCAPGCPILFDYPINNGDETLRLTLNRLGEENVKIFADEYGVLVNDIDEETFQKIIKTIKVSE